MKDGDPAKLKNTQHKAGNNCKNGEMQAWNTNNLDKMEECLEKKSGCSSFRTTTSIYIDQEDRGHKNGGRIPG